MSSPLQIRNVPDEARQALMERAAARGESLNSYLVEVLLREVRRPTMHEVLERAGRRRNPATASAVEIIAAERREREASLNRRG